MAKIPNSAVTAATDDVWAKLNLDEQGLTWNWVHLRKVTWSRKGAERETGTEEEEEEEEEEEVNILRGVEENQLTGSAAPVNTESLPVLRAACSLLESDVLDTRKLLEPNYMNTHTKNVYMQISTVHIHIWQPNLKLRLALLFWILGGKFSCPAQHNITLQTQQCGKSWSPEAIPHGLYQGGNWGTVTLHQSLSPVSVPSRLVLEDPPAVSPWTRVTHNGPHRTMPLWPRSTGVGKASGHGTHKTPAAFQLPRNTDTETARQIDGSGKTRVYQMTRVNTARRTKQSEGKNVILHRHWWLPGPALAFQAAEWTTG